MIEVGSTHRAPGAPVRLTRRAETDLRAKLARVPKPYIEFPIRPRGSEPGLRIADRPYSIEFIATPRATDFLVLRIKRLDDDRSFVITEHYGQRYTCTCAAFKQIPRDEADRSCNHLDALFAFGLVGGNKIDGALWDLCEPNGQGGEG